MTLRLNTLKHAKGSRPKKQVVGRGIGSGMGKTCKRGHKGQRSRSGVSRGFLGFEGGQMPLQRRLPKFGFTSRRSRVVEQLTLSELHSVSTDQIDLQVLKDAGFVRGLTEKVKVILSGKIERAVTLKGIALTKGAKAAIEAAGGSIVEEAK